jgi:hypothetical protein
MHEHTNQYDLRWKLVFIGFLIISAFYLIAEHQAHLSGFWQYLPFILFIGLHFFMHGSHGGHGGGNQDGKGRHQHDNNDKNTLS